MAAAAVFTKGRAAAAITTRNFTRTKIATCGTSSTTRTKTTGAAQVFAASASAAATVATSAGGIGTSRCRRRSIAAPFSLVTSSRTVVNLAACMTEVGEYDFSSEPRSYGTLDPSLPDGFFPVDLASDRWVSPDSKVRGETCKHAHTHTHTHTHTHNTHAHTRNDTAVPQGRSRAFASPATSSTHARTLQTSNCNRMTVRSLSESIIVLRKGV
jgi:hypothetical protein